MQTVGGVEYYMFILDINQTGPNPLLSLNQVQIYANAGDPGAGCVAGLDEASAGNFANLTTGCGTEVFTISNNTVGTDYELQLNYALNAGSGSGDYQFLIAKSAFAGIPLTSNIILFSQFGNPNGDIRIERRVRGMVGFEGHAGWNAPPFRRRPACFCSGWALVSSHGTRAG